MFSYGIRIQQDKKTLRDNLHDLMINLWERQMFLNNTDNLKLYLFNALLNQLFRDKQKLGLRLTLQDLDENFLDQFSDERYAEVDIIRNELSESTASRIKHIMDRLSNGQQEILHLKCYENLSNEAIAKLLIDMRVGL